MIGQTNLIRVIKNQIDNNTFPHFSILVGAKGSGRKTIARDIIPSLFNGSDIVHTLPDVKVDTIRNMIEMAYQVTDTRWFYVIPDADSMSIAAKNALLKITEEPPSNVYFIMTLENENNTLDTIKSRAFIYHMDTYAKSELEQYFTQSTLSLDDDIKDIILSVAETPYDVDELFRLGAKEFYDYVNKVVDHIATVSGANSFKIGEKIAFKGEEDKYDLKLFLRAFNNECIDRFKCVEDYTEDSLMYARAIRVTSEIIVALRTNGVNKSALFDMWVLNIRREWR